MRGSRFDAVLERANERVDGASLVWFRILFGLLMMGHIGSYLFGEHLSINYLQPQYYFSYPGMEWVQRPSDPVLRGMFIGMFASGLLIALGLFRKTAAAFFFLAHTYMLFLDSARYQNHLYLISTLALCFCFIPVDGMVSVRNLFRRGDRSQPPGRKGSRPRSTRIETVPVWALWLIRFEIAVPYVFGGLAKLNRDWLLRGEPMRIWMRDGGIDGSSASPLLASSLGAYGISWLGLVYDLAIVPLLLYRRTRIIAAIATVLFNVMNSEIFSIGVFPWLMLAGTTLFFSPGWPRWIGFFPKLKKGLDPSPGKQFAQLGRIPLAALIVFVVFQLIFPFRHYLYEGPVDWNERGMRFAWRMKLRDKRGMIQFVARDPITGYTEPIVAWVDDVLSPRQRQNMLHDPDMIRRYAQHLRERYAKEGRPGMEIQIQTSISLNGRPAQPMIDPNIDLSRAEPLGNWIVPLRDLK